MLITNANNHARMICLSSSLFIIILVFSFSFAAAQTAPLKEWDARFGGSGYDYFSSLEQTMDGGYILGGYSYSEISGDKTQGIQGGVDYWIVKTDGNGVKQWDARFGGNLDDYLHSVEQTADGGYILGGGTYSGISGDKTQASQGDWDYWIVKTDANGVKQWDARFGGSDHDALFSLKQTADGGYILGGYSYSGISGDKTQTSQGVSDYWIIKTDANGVKQWDARFGGSSFDYLSSLEQTPDGGYILGGRSSSEISGDITQAKQGLYDYWIVKTDANGVKQWDARFGGSNVDFFYSLDQTADGGYILGGYSSSGISGDKTQASQGLSDYWILKTDINGVKQWDARFGGSEHDILFSLKQTADGGYILGGQSYSGISGDKTQSNWDAAKYTADYWIVKTDANGVKQWDARFGGSSYDYFNFLEQTLDGGYMLGGHTDSGISGDKTQASQGGYDYWIVKVASDEISCPAPVNLSAADIRATSAKLTWDAVIEASQYTLFYRPTGTSQWSSVHCSGNEKTITGLTPYTQYTGNVLSICSGLSQVKSKRSASAIFTTDPLRLGDSSTVTSFQLYPNPAAEQTSIQFTLSKPSHICLKVYDVNGKEMEMLLNDELQPGDHSVEISTSHFSKGVYMVRMISNEGIENQKFVVQ